MPAVTNGHACWGIHTKVRNSRWTTKMSQLNPCLGESFSFQFSLVLYIDILVNHKLLIQWTWKLLSTSAAIVILTWMVYSFKYPFYCVVVCKLSTHTLIMYTILINAINYVTAFSTYSILLLFSCVLVLKNKFTVQQYAVLTGLQPYITLPPLLIVPRGHIK